MQKLPANAPPALIDRNYRFFLRRAKGHPELAELGAQTALLRLDCKARYEAHVDAQDERIAAQAEVTHFDARLDRVIVSDLKREVQRLSGYQDARGLERKLFQGMAPSVGMKSVAGLAQTAFVEAVLARLDGDSDYAALAGHAQIIRRNQRDLAAAVDKRSRANVAEGLARADMLQAVAAARHYFNQLQLKVCLAFSADEA